MKKAIWLILIGALLLRILVILMIGERLILGDENQYLDRAAMIVNGEEFRDAFRPPLYTALLAAIHSLFGENLKAIAVVQAVFGTINVLLIFLLAKRFLSRRGALIAAVLASVFPDFVGYTLLIYNETLFLTLWLCCIHLLLKTADAKGGYAAPLAGLLFGLAALTKSALFYFFPLVFVFLFLSPLLSRRQCILRSLLFLLFSTAVILPWSWHLSSKWGRFIPIDDTSKLNLWLSNNTFPPPNWDFGEGFDYRNAKASKDPTPRPKAKTVLGEGFNAAFFSAKNPVLFLSRVFRKLSSFWSPNSILFRYITKKSGVSVFHQDVFYPYFIHALFFIFFMATSILGALSMKKCPLKDLFVLLFVYLTLVHILFFGMSRFRFPLLPFLIIFSASSLLSLKGSFLQLDVGKRRIFFSLCGIVLVFSVVRVAQVLSILSRFV